MVCLMHFCPVSYHATCCCNSTRTIPDRINATIVAEFTDLWHSLAQFYDIGLVVLRHRTLNMPSKCFYVLDNVGYDLFYCHFALI